MSSVSAQRVLLTGAARGIGHAIAQAFVARKAQLALAVRDPHSAAVQALIERAPGSVSLALDLRERGQTVGFVERARAALGGLDVLINCAGVVRYAPLSELTSQALDEQFEVNCFGPSLLARDAAECMRAAGGGVIINVASTLGLRPAPLTAVYAASKAALLSFTRSLALEYGEAGVRVNAVAPGVIDTDMVRAPRTSGTAEGPSTEEQLSRLAQLHVLGRLGTPEEVAQAVVYLVDASFVTGTVLVADGGLLLR